MHADPIDQPSDFDAYVDRVSEREQVHYLPTSSSSLAEDNSPPERPLAAAMARAMRPFTAEELDAAKDPHPHAFAAGDAGLFPVGEVTVVAAQGREGKTYALMGIAATYVRGKRLVGLVPAPQRSAIIYSAEDDRQQYARKLAALRWAYGDTHDGINWCNRIIVPDLEAADVIEWRELVKVMDRRPCPGIAADAIINALMPMMNSPASPGLLIFETASTLSDADEDNAGLKVLVATLKKIAKTLGVAVVLVHHTSQAASANLSTLNIAVSDIRGATALVYNARQCFLLVNLGSESDPHPDNDARTMLRKMVAPGDPSRISALICLDSSKALDPAPIFMQWKTTDYGPALKEIMPPSSVAGLRWRKVLSILSGKRAEARVEARAEAKDGEALAKMQKAIRAVQKLQDDGAHATAKAVSIAAGHAQHWADPHLERAVEQGLLITNRVKLARMRQEVTTYAIPSDWRGENG